MANPSNTAVSTLSYATIEAALAGNVDAINAVLKHYEWYIAILTARTLYDESGAPRLCADGLLACQSGIIYYLRSV